MSSSEKAKFKREKTSGKRIDYNHKRREDGGETGWLDEYQTGGTLPPRYTSNPRKVQLYQDSLNLYNKYQPSFDKYKNWTRLNNIQTASLQGNDLFNQYWGPNKPKGPSPYNENIIIKPVEEMMHHYLRPRSGVVGGFTHLYEKPGNNYLETKISDYLTPNPKQTYHHRATRPDGQWLPYNVGLTAAQIKNNAARKNRMWPVSVTKEDFLDLGLTGVTPDLNSVFRFKKPVQPYVYKKPEVVPDVVNTPVVEPPKPSLFVSNIDRDMYTPGGGMAREYNIGVTLQDGNRKSFRTEKEFQDWKAANNLDISKAKVTEGRGYSYDYPENKKYGGWLNQYQDGGVPSDIERMDPITIKHDRGNWFTRNLHRLEKKIGLDPYNERSDDFMEQWARRINTATGGKDWYKQPNDASGAGGIGTAMMETVMAPFSAPQLASVYGATGKVQMPSEAMNIQNPVGSFLADAILDPTNLVGAGIAKNLGKGSLQNMIRNRSRGVRPDFTPNVSNQLAPPPSEIIVDPTTGQFNSHFNQDMERPYFDEWVRMMNNNASELDISNLFANPAESIDLRKLKKIAKNRSGLTKEEILKNASPKDKEVLSKMSESEFEQTVLKPTGEVVPYEPAVNLGLGFNTNTRNLNLSDVIPMDNSEYVDIFNSRLDRLNEIISRNNKSGLDYSVKGLSPSGALTFNTPAQIEKLAPDTAVLNQLRNRGFMDEAGNIDPRFQDYADRWGITGNRNIPQGESTWMLDINPGQWRGEVEDIANAEYFKAIPGLNMRNTTASVFSDALPRRGTGTYNSINEYLKELDLGRVKPGFNSQSQSSSGLWEDAIKKGKAFGYFNNPGTVYGSMRTVAPLAVGAAAASQLPEQKNGGWLDIYQDGGENLPELNSKIDIANFYKNPLSEKYGIYQDPEDDTYKYYLKSGDESSILQSGPDLSNINSRRLAEINSQKGSLSNTQLANIKNVSPVILPEQKQRILRDKVYYDQEDLMEQAMSESPIPSVKTPSYSEILESDPEFKRVMTEKPKPVAPIKPKPVSADTPLVPIGNAPRAIVKPAVRKVVAKNDIVNLADLTITKADLAYLNKVEEYCPGGNCLETTRNAYDMLPGRIQGIPTSSDIWSNDLKIHSKKGTPTPNDIKQYPYFAGDSGSGTVDSWDIHGVIVANGGKNLFNINNPTPIDYKQIPVGAVIGWGPANKKDSSYSGRSKGYNKQFGMQPSHHSTMVTGYSETGEPIVYDGYLKKYMTLTEAKANIGSSLSYELENISAPKSILNNTQDNLKSQGILLNYIPPTNINPNKILAAANQPWAQIPEGSAKRAPRFNKQMMTEFNSALINNKGELMRNLNISSEKYDELAKVALAIQAQESEGGGALGVIDGSTIGMTQLNPDNIFKDDKLKKAASKPYILNDGSNNILKPELIKTPSGSAVATMIYLSKLDKDSERYYNEGKVPKDRSFTKNSNIIKDALRSNTSKYNADGFFVEEANKRIDLSPFEGGILSSPDPVGAQKLLNKTAGVADKYKVSVKNGSLVVTMKTKGNADLSVAERIGYAWQSPNTLKSGDAQGDSVYTRRIKNYYDLLNNTTPTYRKEGGETGWLKKYK
jgi:hypothetical protein